jgi:hypothetical protein
MRKSAILLMAGISLAAVAPANAATFVNGDYSFNFNGITESFSGFPDPAPGLAATLDLTVSGAGTNSWTFVYTLSNISDSSIWDSARVSGFGFDVTTAGFLGGTVGGTPFNKIYTPGSFPSLGGLGGSRDVCINGNPGGGACQGGGSIGPLIGGSVTGSFTLNFDAAQSAIDLDNGIIRWQSLTSEELGISGGSGIGLISEVPEPATWLTMIAGFGLIGASLRRQRGMARVIA